MTQAQILVVEDERIVAEDIRRSLQNMGYTVSAIVSSGEEALSKAERLRPDLVLMDIVLEGKMNGIATANQIRTRFNIPVIYLTAYSGERLVEQAKVTEPFGYVIKPFENRDLRSSIEVALYKAKAEKALRESEERYRTLVETSPHAIMLTDLDSKILMCNQQTLAQHGCESVEEIVGKFTLDFIAPEDHQRTNSDTQKTLEMGSIRNVEYTFLKQDGTRFPGELSLSLIKDSKGEPKAIMAVSRDIAMRKQAEEEIRKSHEQLHNLAAHLESIREEERTLIAREIHDELGQALTALKMDMSWLGKKLSAGQDFLSEKIESMTRLLDITIQTVKKISTELRPGLLDDLGLAAAIEWQAEDFQKRTGISCEISIKPEDIILDKERSTAVFRIFQETLTNIARHSRASMVEVSMRMEDNMIELKVQDNGKGISEEQVNDHNSFGIIGIRERVNFLGGNVEIRGQRNKGTSITVKIPLQQIGET